MVFAIPKATLLPLMHLNMKESNLPFSLCKIPLLYST